MWLSARKISIFTGERVMEVTKDDDKYIVEEILEEVGVKSILKNSFNRSKKSKEIKIKENKKRSFLPFKKLKTDKDEKEPAAVEGEQAEEELPIGGPVQSVKKKSFFLLGSRKKDIIFEEKKDNQKGAAEGEEILKNPKESTDKAENKVKFFSLKKKAPTKEPEPDIELDEPQGSCDTELESKLSESIENKITVQDSQNEVYEKVAFESQILTLSVNALSSSLTVSAPPSYSVDRDISNEEYVVSIDRSMPADDIIKPLPDEKKHDREEDATLAVENQGLFDTEAEIKLLENTENKIAFQDSQLRVCDSVESEKEPVVLSTNTSSVSPSISLTPAYSEHIDIEILAKESIMSPDIPEQDISSIPLPDEKKYVEEESLELLN